MKNIFIFAMCLFLSGCKILPYKDDFSCKLEDAYGKCISSEKAYEEAVTGKDFGHQITTAGVKDDPKASAAKTAASVPSSAVGSASYGTYRERVYSQLSKLIEQPKTPVIKPAKVVRTLILAYSPSMDGTTSYMPRYAYSILEGSQFVLSGYELRQEAMTPSFLNGNGGK
ncbi:TraV family lipoprotein [Dickeya sp. NCPPB 3274]|uniref:TraV family lipoprotein n=1 Tax=Dickeya sp. NCPPB 3274 TaxID=568766 RepID=UPI0005B476E3|nr:TraV family lipoprotein [Dickeya sp. NCPPB 3274]